MFSAGYEIKFALWGRVKRSTHSGRSQSQTSDPFGGGGGRMGIPITYFGTWYTIRLPKVPHIRWVPLGLIEMDFSVFPLTIYGIGKMLHTRVACRI